MTLLAVDTALGGCSVAVLNDSGVLLAHCFEPMDRGHAERLAPMVDAAMQSASLAFSQLNRLGVTTGPGTFTGQRVGLAFMRGLRLALHIPLNGVTTLAAIAAAAAYETGRERVAVIHDARREEAYFLLRDGDGIVQPPTVMAFGAAVEQIRSFGACALAGTGASLAKPALQGDFMLCEVRQPDALWVARLALAEPPAPEAPGPLYLRAPDAKLPGGQALV